MMPRAVLDNLEIELVRRRLCAAALALYREEGADAVSFRRLAERTGTSHTQPYRYFENKDALFAALRLDCYQRFFDRIRDCDLPGSDPAARLQAIHHGILEFVRAQPADYQLMFAADQPPLADYPDLLAVRRAAFDYLVAIVAEATEAGPLDGDPRDIMHVAWGAVHGLLNLHTAGQLLHGRRLEELTQPLLRTVLHPLFETDHDVLRSA